MPDEIYMMKNRERALRIGHGLKLLLPILIFLIFDLEKCGNTETY